MPTRESEMLMSELKNWCDEKYGRRAEIARMLGVSRQLITDWFGGRATPTLDVGLQLQAFLKKQRKAKVQSVKNGS